MNKRNFLFFLLAFLFSFSFAQTIEVEPYLQDAEPTSIWILWETNNTDESTVFWGTDTLLGDTATGSVITTLISSKIHEVELTGLTPATVYYYQVKTGSTLSGISHLKTPPDPASESSFNLIAASDIQRDGANPSKWNEIVHDGIIDYVTDNYGPDLAENVGLMLIPGDLVDNGLVYAQWADEYFEPAEPLFEHVTQYPVLGNHEINTPYYFNYFHLPENGTSGNEEHWYYKDYSNTRIIGLNSNPPFDNATQLSWLEDVLDATCLLPEIDFVFAELHHPHQSELWTPGESNFTGEVKQRLENFSTDCGKPSIHFFGHTHGYSRGQSRDHSHMMVNVATAGGNIDYWGEFANADYEDYTVSQDEYGFVVMEVEAGTDPKFTLKRIGRGDAFTTEDNVVRDSITVLFNNTVPNKPDAVFPNGQTLSPDCVVLQGSPYVESDGNRHMATHWQVSTDCADFSSPIYEKLRNHENHYFEVNTQAGDDLTDEQLLSLPDTGSFCWRVRYRDFSLGWSEWSDPASFNTLYSSLSPNLLVNGDAETGDITGWTVTTGVMESLTAGECSGTTPHSGAQYFAVGAICVEFFYASAYQEVDMTPWFSAVDSGFVRVHFGGYLRNFSGSDRPKFILNFLDFTGTPIDSTDEFSTTNNSWTLFNESALVPPGTRSIQYVVRGRRNSGSDNDSYFDDLFLQVNGSECNTLLTSIEEETLSNTPSMLIQPNPFANETRISISNAPQGSWEFTLYDLNGKKVGEKSITSTPDFILQRKGLANGIYFIEGKNKEFTVRQKMVVQ